jgi:hypothetical protein
MEVSFRSHSRRLCSATARPPGNGLNDMLRVPTHTLDHGGGKGIEELQADEVESRLARDHATCVMWLALAKDRQLNPEGESRRIPRTPDDVRHLQHTAIFQLWPSTLYANHPGDAYDSGGGQIFRLDADER